MVRQCELDWSDSGLATMADLCEHGDELSSLINAEEFDYLNDYELFEKVSALWKLFINSCIGE
jgi:hypothetical protein